MTDGIALEHIGHYVVEAPLGHGAMGAVYLARDERIGRRVALKQVQLSKTQFEDSASADEFYKRLQREAEVCGSLQHPNIVTLYDVGYENDRISYLALEYVAGETLLDVLKRHRPGPLPVAMALGFAADVLRGLAYAHGRGIVHRDIKPANILIGHDGMAKISDFGIARPQRSSMTIAGALMGTPNYMPPEQVQGIRATPRSDLFSLGVLLFEMVTGTKPFAASDLAATLEKIVRMPAPSAAAMNAEVPFELDVLIQRLMAKSPEDRPADAGEALETVERLRSPAPATEDRPVPLAAQPGFGEETKSAQQDGTERPAPEVFSLLRRRIPTAIFLVVIVAVSALAAIPSFVIWSRIDDRPTGQNPSEQLAELGRKREALRAADELFRSGKYGESLKAYEAYLALYPQSTVARQGADRSRSAIGKPDNDRAAIARAKPQPEEEKKEPLLQGLKRRVKRLFRGH